MNNDKNLGVPNRTQPREADDFDAMASSIVAQHQDQPDDEAECGEGCHFHPTYGWVVMAGCSLHD